MENELDYKNAVAYIGGTEAVQAKQSTVIDINDVFANKLDIRSLNTNDINNILDRLDLKKTETYTQPAVRQKVQEQVLQQGDQLGVERENAARVLGGIVKKIGKEFEESVSKEIKQVGAEKLMLPKLSLSDQIHDLKLIEEGLDEGVFDAEQMSVINTELRNLYSVIISEKTTSMDADQMALKQIRDQLCKGVFNKLNFGQSVSAA